MMATTILLMRSSTRRPSPSESMSLIPMINSATVKKKKKYTKIQSQSRSKKFPKKNITTSKLGQNKYNNYLIRKKLTKILHVNK